MGIWEGRDALIISAGPEKNLDYVRTILHSFSNLVIICADGGMRYAEQLNIAPDLVVADLDSADKLINCREFIRLMTEKDDTDTQHCVQIAIERGCHNIYLVCATGGRIDHLLANLSLCEYAATHSCRLIIRDQGNLVCYQGEGTQEYRMIPDLRYISIIPLDSCLSGVTLAGLKYPLQSSCLYRSEVISISNEPVQSHFSITIAKGKALVVFSADQ